MPIFVFAAVLLLSGCLSSVALGDCDVSSHLDWMVGHYLGVSA